MTGVATELRKPPIKGKHSQCVVRISGQLPLAPRIAILCERVYLFRETLSLAVLPDHLLTPPLEHAPYLIVIAVAGCVLHEAASFWLARSSSL